MAYYNHDALYSVATKEQLCGIMDEWLHTLKYKEPDLYEELEDIMYESVRGQHFDREQYDRAMSRRSYRNGSHSPKWSVEQVSDYARRNGDRYDRYNEYDLAYTMNRLYDDYSNTIGENPETYYRMARQHLDEQEGRAWRDYRDEARNARRRDSRGRFTDYDRGNRR